MQVLSRSYALQAILERLEHELIGFNPPLVHQIVNEYGFDPFFVLISCLMSLRARDSVVLPVARKLFSYVHSPEDLLTLKNGILEEILYSIGFFKRKSFVLRQVCKELLDRHAGKVPRDKVKLLALYGVGPKTASLVIAEGFGDPAICVDTHVARISRITGLVNTNDPLKIEEELMGIASKERWRDINFLFVMYGQYLCTPWAKNCRTCPRPELCRWMRAWPARIGV